MHLLLTNHSSYLFWIIFSPLIYSDLIPLICFSPAIVVVGIRTLVVTLSVTVRNYRLLVILQLHLLNHNLFKCFVSFHSEVSGTRWSNIILFKFKKRKNLCQSQLCCQSVKIKPRTMARLQDGQWLKTCWDQIGKYQNPKFGIKLISAGNWKNATINPLPPQCWPLADKGFLLLILDLCLTLLTIFY